MAVLIPYNIIDVYDQGRQRETTLANTWYMRLWVCSRTILWCRYAVTAPHLEYHL